MYLPTFREVVSYRNSTSNHNSGVGVNATMSLYLIEILHQTTTVAGVDGRRLGCILSKFYIKPQLEYKLNLIKESCILSKFYIKPQQQRSLGFSYVVVSYRNSTSNHNDDWDAYCYGGVVSYRNSTSNHNSSWTRVRAPSVVSYRNSTSNHNNRSSHNIGQLVVSYRNSTSNHNSLQHVRIRVFVVSYRNSTSNHN